MKLRSTSIILLLCFFSSSSAENTAQNRGIQVNMERRFFFFSLSCSLKCSFESAFFSHKRHRSEGVNREVA